jgi:hypothetical protein
VAQLQSICAKQAWELGIPKSIVQKVLKKWLLVKPYRIQLLQGDKQRKYDLHEQMLNHLDEDEDFLGKFVFSDEATFHISGLVNRHNVWTWGSEPPRVIVTHQHNSPKLNVFCVPSVPKIYGIFLRRENCDWNSFPNVFHDGAQKLQSIFWTFSIVPMFFNHNVSRDGSSLVIR